MTGLLDLFSIGFNSEGLKDFETQLKQTEKELDKAEKEVTALEKELERIDKEGGKTSDTFKAVEKELEQARARVKQFGDQVKTMQGQSESQLLKLKKNFISLTKTLGMLAAVGVSIKKSLDFYEQAEQLDFLAQKTGIATDKLQLLGNAVKKYGGTTEDTAGTIENLRKQPGVMSSENPEQSLENIARKMEKLRTEQEKWDFANSLGIDEGTTRLLIQGVSRYREELKKAEQYQLYTKEDIERMKEYQRMQTDIRMGTERVFATIWRGLLPAFLKVAKVVRSITDWLSAHEGIIKIVGTLVAITVGIMGVISAVKLLNIALKLLAANKIILIITGFAALITLIIAGIQDLITFLHGGESIIGSILEKMGVNTNALRENIINFFNSVKNGVDSGIEKLKSFGGKIAEIAQKVKSFWDSLPDPLKKLIGLSNPISGTYTVVSTAKEQIAKANNNKLNSVPDGAISTYNSTQSINNNNNENARTITSSKNSTRNVNIQNVTVQTQAKDGKDVARAIQGLSEFDNGMRI